MIMIAFSYKNVPAQEQIGGFADGLIDDRSSGDLRANTGMEWRLISDDVMGGLSAGQLIVDRHREKECLRLSGNVTTENNGGFLQMALSFEHVTLHEDTVFDASEYAGVEIEVSGNNESYNIHFRTDELWFPWQAYRASFYATDEWVTIRIPFNGLQPYKTSTRFSPEALVSIGVVAIGRDFEADLCLASLRFYRE